MKSHQMTVAPTLKVRADDTIGENVVADLQVR